jgi:glycosyltransferase involved in cell wall biosynthesis
VSPDIPYPPDDGIRLPMYKLAAGLGERHRVTLACFISTRDQEVPELRELVSEMIFLRRRSSWLLLAPLMLIKALLGIPPSVVPFSGLRATRRVRKLFRQETFDVCICQLPHTWPVTRAAKDVTKVIVVQDVVHYTVHLNMVYESWSKRLFSRVNAHLLRRFERKAYREVARCSVVSEHERERLTSLAPQAEAWVIPNGVDTQFFSFCEPPPDGAPLLYLGALSGSRNEAAAWFLATRIMPRLREKYPSLRLWIVGKKPSKRLLRLAARTVWLNLTGTVPDVRPYISQTCMYLSPQAVGTGIRNSVLEVMAMGRPCLLSPGSAEGIEGIDGRDFIICRTSDAFVDAASSLLQSRDRREELGRSARSLVARVYSWEAFVRRTEELAFVSLSDT